MNLFSKNIYLPIALCCTLSFSSCYESMLDYEQDGQISTGGSYSETLDKPEYCVAFLREGQMRVIDTRMHKYQFQTTLHIDEYAGYMSNPHSFDGRLPSSFAFNDNFSSGPQANFTWLTQQTIPVRSSAKNLGVEPLGAFASILFCVGAQQFTDAHGPIPIKDYMALKEEHPLEFQPQSEVYSIIFHELDSAIVLLQDYLLHPTAEVDNYIQRTDIITQAKEATNIVKMWIKFANSIRLRMAMTAHKVDGYTVDGKTMQQIAEEAVSSGVLEAEDSFIGLLCGSGTLVGNHPLFSISRTWVDSRLNASYENILRRTQHPVLEKWFNKNHGKLINVLNEKALEKGDRIIGMRAGTYLRPASESNQDYQLFSCLSDYFMGVPLTFIKVEEVLFLRAEGALYGWNMGGTAESFYNEGISQFFKRNTLLGYDEYMSYAGLGSLDASEEDLKEGLYRDYYDFENDLLKWDGYWMLNNAFGPYDRNPYTSKTGIEEKEMLLEKIITQKWIANYPMSLVAWTDYRRTGYPKLLPPAELSYSDADGTIIEPEIEYATGKTLSHGLYIQRLPYNIEGDNEIAAEIESSAIPALNSETSGSVTGDKQGTRLWWNVNKANF